MIEAQNPQNPITQQSPALTLDAIKKMSDEELRVKVAELCAWTKVRKTPENSGLCRWIGNPPSHLDVGWGEFSRLPDFSRDLNAMHEAEGLLTEEQQAKYYDSLTWEAFGCGLHSITHRNEKVKISATARQRCEAFILTLQGCRHLTE